MAAKKPKEFAKIPIKRLTENHLRELIAETFVKSTQEVLQVLEAPDDTNEVSLIEMAVVRCAWLGYFDGDVKRLEWLLNKMGIKEVSDKQDATIDLSSLTSDKILKALNVKKESPGAAKKGKKPKVDV